MAQETISCTKNGGGLLTITRCRKERDEEKCKRTGCPFFFNQKIRRVFESVMLKQESVYCTFLVDHISLEHCLMIQADGGGLQEMCKGCVEPYRLCLGCGKSRKEIGPAFDAGTGLCLACSLTAKQQPQGVASAEPPVSSITTDMDTAIALAPSSVAVAVEEGLPEPGPAAEAGTEVTLQTEGDIPIEQVEGITPNEAARLREKGNITTLQEFLAASLEAVQGCMMGRQVSHIKKIWQGLQQGFTAHSAESVPKETQPAQNKTTREASGECPVWDDINPKTRRFLANALGIYNVSDLEKWTVAELRAHGVFDGVIVFLRKVLRGRGKDFRQDTSSAKLKQEVAPSSTGVANDDEVKARLRNIEETDRRLLKESERTNLLLASILEKLERLGGRQFLLMPLGGDEPVPTKMEGTKDGKEE